MQKNNSQSNLNMNVFNSQANDVTIQKADLNNLVTIISSTCNFIKAFN